MELLTLLLPVVWILVATAVGLVLYRSSEALVEDMVSEKTRRQRVRLTGAFAIAIVSFFAMKLSTPDSRLQLLPVGKVVVDESVVALVLAGSERTSSISMLVAAKLAAGDVTAARESLRAMSQEVAQLQAAAKSLRQEPR